MELQYADIEDFKKSFNNYYPMDECDCGGQRELEICTVSVKIGRYKVVVSGCPVLFCHKCCNQWIGHRVLKYIYSSYCDFENHPGTCQCNIHFCGNKRFEYAEEASFIYDSRDLNIPGCDIDMDPTHKDGFSLPVYFDRKVLNNFNTDNDYELDFFSETYGNIAKKGTDGYDFDWIISFGINASGKVVVFLGDLDMISEDERAILWLKSYNVKSDHQLVRSEFYKAQMKSLYSNPIIEDRIISLQTGFYHKIKERYSISLFHLEDEVKQKRKSIKKPINYNEREISANILLLDGILNEGIEQGGLRALCDTLGIVVSEDNNTKTRKLLQAIIAHKEGDDSAMKIMAPLFYLNDLRLYFAHLLPHDKTEKTKRNIVTAFGLSAFTDYEMLYKKLTKKLYALYRYLYVTDFD